MLNLSQFFVAIDIDCSRNNQRKTQTKAHDVRESPIFDETMSVIRAFEHAFLEEFSELFVLFRVEFHQDYMDENEVWG